jgi:DNA-binding NarL/FixJ family response regulator
MPISPEDGPSPADVGLTAREMQVLALLRRGFTNREIAEALGVSESTTAKHVNAIGRKLGVRNRTEAALWAIAQTDDLEGHSGQEAS